MVEKCRHGAYKSVVPNVQRSTRALVRGPHHPLERLSTALKHVARYLCGDSVYCNNSGNRETSMRWSDADHAEGWCGREKSTSAGVTMFRWNNMHSYDSQGGAVVCVRSAGAEYCGFVSAAKLLYTCWSRTSTSTIYACSCCSMGWSIPFLARRSQGSTLRLI